MSRYDFEIAQELIADSRVSPESLIMALCWKQPGFNGYKIIREHFGDIAREFWDRHYGIDGYVRGESATTDNLFHQRDVENLLKQEPKNGPYRARGRHQRSQ